MVTRLRENVWWIHLGGVNAYLVDDDGTLTLVDAGLPWNRNQIADAITDVSDSIADLDRILITHYDIDHVGGLAIDALDATIYVRHPDAAHLTRESKPSLRSRKGLAQRAVDWWRDVPSLPVRTIEDGDTVGSFTAYSAPGHTPGHTVFASESLSTAFLGDLVRESAGQFAPSPWFICADHSRTLNSIVSMAERLPPFEIACPGHGVPFIESGDHRFQTCAASIDTQTLP